MTELNISLQPEKVKAIEQEAVMLFEQCESVVVESQEQYEAAGELLISVKARLKRIEALKEEMIRPFADAVNSARKKFKFYSEPFEKMDAMLRSKINVFAQKQYDEAQRKAAEQRKIQEAKRIIEAKNKKADQSVVELKPVEQPDLSVRTENGALHTRRRWTFEVEDLSKVPSKYLMVDSKAVNEAIASGDRSIAGLKIYEAIETAVR